jgi:hypothetical protein
MLGYTSLTDSIPRQHAAAILGIKLSACMGDIKNVYKLGLENLLEELAMYGRITLENPWQGMHYCNLVQNMMAGHAAQTGEKRNAYKILVGKSEGEIPLARPRCRWVSTVKMDLRNTDGEVSTSMVWLSIGTNKMFKNSCRAVQLVVSQEGFSSMELVQDGRVLVNTVINIQVLRNSENFLTG